MSANDGRCATGSLTNVEPAMDDRTESDDARSNIGKVLNALSEKGKEWSEVRLNATIQEILGEWTEIVEVWARRGGGCPRVAWAYRDPTVRKGDRQDVGCTRSSARIRDSRRVELFGSTLGRGSWRKRSAQGRAMSRRTRCGTGRSSGCAGLLVRGLPNRLEMVLDWKLLEGRVKQLDVQSLRVDCSRI
ncbi:MAG: hypothetical protein JRN54_00890 [Nitrososphaerota archaeon]|nr:hypothetical protein [Nitrososphaerota archaeon]